jgi:CubicO group peptidase (beta-lactamase class C family)
MSARQGCYSSLQYLLVGYGISGLVVARKPRTGCRPRCRVSATLGVILAASIFCGAAYVRGATEPIWPTKEWQTSSPEEQGMDSKELANVVDFGAAHNFDSLLVVRHGKIVAEVYYAPYTAGIPHAIYSATKAVISTLIGIATKDGLLDSPSHRALDFFDRRSIANVDDRKEAITVQSLLDMTSGLEWAEPLGGMPDAMFEMERSPDWVKFILDRPMSGAPGDAFSYNSGNAHLLSATITKLTRITALDYAKAKLFGPLGINGSYWRQDPQGISIGGLGLYLCPRDMAKIGYLYLRNGEWEGMQLLPSAWIDKVTDATVNPHAPGEPELRYGNLFWALPEKHVYMANGYHSQLIMVFPDLDVVAITAGRDFCPLTKLVDSISASVKSATALPPDAASATLLTNKILDVSTEKPTGVSAIPEIAAVISGKVYRFHPNALNLKSMSLILTYPKPRIDMETDGGELAVVGEPPLLRRYRDEINPRPRFSGPIGLDGLYRKGELTEVGVNAVKGTWQNEHTFVIDRLILGQGQPAERWTLTFDGQKLQVRAELEGFEISMDGETEG